MLPGQLQAEQFKSYPPEARKLAADNLGLLRRMPLLFVPLLLREVISFDWKFPAERSELLDQFRYLQALSLEQFHREMAPFAAIRLASGFESSAWVEEPANFSEQLSSHLWATHQIAAFRQASVNYVAKLNAARTPAVSHNPRLTVVMMGRDVTAYGYPLFRKLRRSGLYFSNVEGDGGRSAIQEVLQSRAKKHAEPFSHWYIDGGDGISEDGVATVSYNALQAARDALVTKMRLLMTPGGAGPEALRTMMARMTPGDLGLRSDGEHAVLNRFQISVLTEGSGTQLFSTTFVQWTAREVLRRAQPLTVVLSYSPRQREQSMQELLSGKAHAVEFDFPGSLIDADMGAYYTWLNASRLPNSQNDTFVGWFEGGREAIAVGPHFEKGRESHEAVTLRHLLARAA